MTDSVLISKCTKSDFDQILTQLTDFWGSDRTAAFHHPVFLYEFGSTAWVLKEGELVLAYLFGFFSGETATGYIHLVAVRKEWQKKGLGRHLVEEFAAAARLAGCTRMKAITTPGNLDSIQFHLAMGMRMSGEAAPGDIPVVRDYSGPGMDRVVFIREI
ncbi:MAG: GNAT family N-acetyltransferase [Bacteroidetes bacterium]|nr:GNAT family N-acetyltransferase [Bacteroidota bacterium]